MKKTMLVLAVLALFQTAKAQVIEDFENWNPFSIGSVSLTEPVNWSGSDSLIVGFGATYNPGGTFQAQLFKDNPGYAGTGALRVATKFQDTINAGLVLLPAKDYPAFATNAKIVLNFLSASFSLKGGTPIVYKPLNTEMWVKNNLVSGDTARITALLIDNSDGADSILAIADTLLTNNISSFTKISLPFQYGLNNSAPTIIRYTISSGNIAALLDTTNTYSAHSGTEIIVDNIEINAPNGVKHVINGPKLANVYPTRLTDRLHIDLFQQHSNTELQIYSTSGQLIISRILNKQANQLDINSLSSGSYIYAIKSNGIIYQTGKLMK